MKQVKWLLITPLILALAISCGKKEKTVDVERTYDESPQLVVGIMVDQLRPDYVDRFWDKLGDDGFKRLVRDGFTFTNARFDYGPTSTGPGHASVFTGTTPAVHGAINNSWYVRELERSVNVIESYTEDHTGVGSDPDYDGNKGPTNMLTTTFGDELILHTNMESRVVSMSRKDRGAILPGGHLGDAYWYEASTGNFVTSTFYHDQLPAWVQEFNDRNLPQEYLSEPWETLLPIGEYTESMEDDNPYERMFSGTDSPAFPHDLPYLMEEHGYGYGLLSSTPFSDKHLLEFALAAIEGEELGQRGVTDVLAIAFSAMDAVGHQFGPASKELQDMMLRLDQYLAQLIDYLEAEFGKENILLFLTSDHGVAYVPDHLTDLGVQGGHFDSGDKLNQIRDFMESEYGVDFLEAFTPWTLFFNYDLMGQNNIDHSEAQKRVAHFVRHLDGVAGSLTAESLIYNDFTSGLRKVLQEGFHQKRSGDILFWIEPQRTLGTGSRGTTHGSPWVYDTHAPMHWYGFTVPAGRSAAPAFISDFAPTVSTFLNSPFPSGTTGNPLNDYMKRKR